MTGPKILVTASERATGRLLTPSPDSGWYLLGIIGWVFALVSGADIVLAWFPLNFGNPEWEFGTVTTSLNSFPLLAMGLVLMLGAASVRGAKRGVQILSGLFLLLALVIVCWAVLYLKNVPIALQTVTEPEIRSGLKRAITKTSGQAILYPIAFAAIGVLGWKRARAG